MSDLNTPVAGVAAAGVPAQAGMPSPAGVPAGTPSTTPSDASVVPAQVPAHTPPAQRPVTQEDLRRLQSSADTRHAQTVAEFQRREQAYQAELDQARTQGMDENQRREYEWQRATQQLAQEQQRLQQQAQALQAQSVTQQWATYFQSLGVPQDRLVINGDPNQLLESGWGYVRERLNGSPAQPQNAVQSPTAPGLVAPAVVTQTGALPAASNWASLRAKYNTNDEGIYRMAEQGLIPPSEIPPA